MTLMILLFVASICTSTVSALLIQTPQQIQPPGTEPDLDPTLSNTTINRGTINDSLLSTPTNNLLDQGHNTSLSKLNLSVEPSYNCDEGRESDLLTLRMCAEALASVPWVIGPERRSISFGPREAHVFDIGLPRRFMSSDEICAIQPFLVPGKTSAHMAPRNAFVATANVIRKCVSGTPSQGGQVRDFGGDNNLLVTVSEYDAFLWADNVRCFGSTGGAGIVESCNGLADRMDVSDGRKSFGPRDLPHDYVIPYTLTTGKRKSALRYISLLLTYTDFSSTNNRCYLKITSHPDNLYTRTASWHRIWEYAILVNAMCIRAAKKGVFHVLAADVDDRWLEVEMGDLQASNNLTLSLNSV